jgi:hypothetical protein
MDDNKLLTLPNGERIRLASHVKLLFEVADLQYASPATISRCGLLLPHSCRPSHRCCVALHDTCPGHMLDCADCLFDTPTRLRCGMVFVDSRNLGWRPYLWRWLTGRTTPGESDALRPLFEKYAAPGIAWVLEGDNGEELVKCPVQSVPLTALNLLTQLCSLLDTTLAEAAHACSGGAAGSGGGSAGGGGAGAEPTAKLLEPQVCVRLGALLGMLCSWGGADWLCWAVIFYMCIMFTCPHTCRYLKAFLSSAVCGPSVPASCSAKTCVNGSGSTRCCAAGLPLVQRMVTCEPRQGGRGLSWCHVCGGRAACKPIIATAQKAAFLTDPPPCSCAAHGLYPSVPCGQLPANSLYEYSFDTTAGCWRSWRSQARGLVL